MQTICVEASKRYDILVGQGILPELFVHADGLKSGARVFVVTDENVAALHLNTLTALLTAHNVDCEVYILPSGETSKSFANLEKMLERLAQCGFSHGDCLLAFGGGVVGDITALCAALYLRGVDVIQIPTTLLAAVDSSVGGKCAVDLAHGKNLAGTFHQPSLVLCDTELLCTLPKEEFANGMAEVIKYALGFDKELFFLCEAGVDASNLVEVICACVRIKRAVVACDEFDRGERKKLNLAHTAAHAVEALSHYTVPHGAAVGMGLSLMAHAFLNDSLAARVDALLLRYGLTRKIPYRAAELACAAKTDKKRTSNSISLIVPTALGACEIQETALDALEAIFQRGLQ